MNISDVVNSFKPKTVDQVAKDKEKLTDKQKAQNPINVNTAADNIKEYRKKQQQQIDEMGN